MEDLWFIAKFNFDENLWEFAACAVDHYDIDSLDKYYRYPYVFQGGLW